MICINNDIPQICNGLDSFFNYKIGNYVHITEAVTAIFKVDYVSGTQFVAKFQRSL
ncbi:hypothetical protein KTC97_04125 [Clostridium estertheticum]|uniref:hypothetical protein n=1 Tax=Clostridium estertheticum TaxID=238834 RepID=UPI002715416C|nr:hypothetical protein [Clostridium estertheticum]WLC84966.1 hypothetical protein KTC97_04125 [Clostridium estertheticum]